MCGKNLSVSEKTERGDAEMKKARSAAAVILAAATAVLMANTAVMAETKAAGPGNFHRDRPDGIQQYRPDQ